MTRKRYILHNPSTGKYLAWMRMRAGLLYSCGHTSEEREAKIFRTKKRAEQSLQILTNCNFGTGFEVTEV